LPAATWRLVAPVYYYRGVSRAALKSSAAADAFRTYLDLKNGGDERNPLVADAQKRLAQ